MGRGLPFKVIDFNPHMHRQLELLGVPCTYGDISHLDTLEHAGAGEARVLVSSIPDDFLRGTTNRKLLEGFRRLNPRAATIVTAESTPQALELYAAGADYVLVPRLMAADRLVEVLEAALSGSLEAMRAGERERLSQRAGDPA
jgi:voltage-gated potassium channel Kch